MRFNNAYHPGIQIAAIPIRNSVGLFIVAATTVVFLWGISFAVFYVCAALISGMIVYMGMQRHRRLHPPEPPLELHLK